VAARRIRGLLLAVGILAGCGSDRSAGFLAGLLGNTLRQSLGLAAGEFTRFDLRRVQMVDVKMAAPKLSDADTSARPVFLRVAEIDVEYRPLDLWWNRRIEKVEIRGPELWLGEAFSNAAGSAAPPGTSTPYRIGTLAVSDITVHVDNLSAHGASIPLRFARDSALVLHDVHLGNLGANPQDDVLQTLRAEQVVMSAAYGPMAPLVTVDAVVVRFTWRDLAARRISELGIEHPVLHIGEDWFNLVEDLGTSQPAARPAAASGAPPVAEAPFVLSRFDVEGLEMTLSSWGVVQLRLPFKFSTDASDVPLDPNGAFLLRTELKVAEPDWDLPEYGLHVRGLSGDLRFNWPPQTGDENVVRSVKAEELVWNGTRARNPWLSLTIMPAPPVRSAVSRDAEAKADLRFGSELGTSYANGWVGANFSLVWSGTASARGTDLGHAAPFDRLGLPGLAGLDVAAAGTGTQVAKGRGDLVNTRGTRMSVELGGEVTRFLQETLGIAESTEAEAERARIGAAVAEQRLRSGDVQAMKNLRLVGENARGLLEARAAGIDDRFPGAEELVRRENASRDEVYRYVARRDTKPLDVVQHEYAEQWRLRSYPDEWLETDDGRWYQK